MEKEIGRLKKNATSEIIVRIDDFGGKKGLTVREFVTSEKYTGFTKSGVRISPEEFLKFREMVNSVNLSDLQNPETETGTGKAKESEVEDY